MCLTITKDSERLTQNLKEKKEPITAYKVLSPDIKSGYFHFQWKVGLNISDRELTRLTKKELETSKINEGFHLALEKPEECQCPCQYLYRRQYLYQCRYQYNKVFKCKIDPKDIVSAGIWEGIPSIVATKVILVEEVRYGD